MQAVPESRAEFLLFHVFHVEHCQFECSVRVGMFHVEQGFGGRSFDLLAEG